MMSVTTAQDVKMEPPPSPSLPLTPPAYEASTTTTETMHLSVLSHRTSNNSGGNNELKMNQQQQPQDFERFEHQVEDMYNVLLNISSELLTIKSMMKVNRKLATEQHQHETINEAVLTVPTGNGAITNSSRLASSMDGDIGNNKRDQRILSPPSLNRVSLSGSSSHVVASTTITNLDSQSQKFKLEDIESPIANIGRSPSGGNSKFPHQMLNVGNNYTVPPSDQVALNVGGKRHEVRWDTLDKFPNSRLGRLRHSASHRGIQELCDSYNLANREYFFDRSPRNFDAILGLYRTGKLHLSQGVCVQDFCEELDYWGLCDLHLEPCCQHTYYRARWLLPEALNSDECMDGYFNTSFWGDLQHKLWNLVENPNSSFAAKLVAITSCLFVVASTMALIISTLPMFKNKNIDIEYRGGGDDDDEHYAFSVAEAIFVGWFTFEYVIRFVAAPQKWRFIKAGMNIIDLLGVIPYFLSLTLSIVKGSSDEELDDTYHDAMERIAQTFRIMRILRIFKLARHIIGLQTLALTLKNSYKELGLLMLVVIMGMLIFSGLAYVSERNEENTGFISMPQALYWAIITMTSVGYGDIYPTTWFGKLVGSACAICGVLCISLPIPIIVNNFNKFYEKAKIEEEIEAKRKKTSWEDAKRDFCLCIQKELMQGKAWENPT